MIFSCVMFAQSCGSSHSLIKAFDVRVPEMLDTFASANERSITDT